MIYVIAGSKRQAEQWARHRRLTPQAWRYVSTAEHLLGVRDAEVVLTGTYWVAPVGVLESLRYSEGMGDVRVRREPVIL